MNYDLAKLMKDSLDKIKKIANSSDDPIKNECIERFRELEVLNKKEEYHYVKDGWEGATKDNWFVDIKSNNIVVRCKSSYEDFITTPTGFYLAGKHYPDFGEEGCLLFKKLS